MINGPADVQPGQPRSGPSWLRWAGRALAALVLVGLVAIGLLAAHDWYQQRQRIARLVEDSRTHTGPLTLRDDPYIRGSAIEQLHRLPPLAALHGNGLRFVVMPSFSDWYALALTLPPGADQAQGVLVATARQGNQTGGSHTRRFSMPRPAYTKLMRDFDRLTDGWPGDQDGLCVDGSSVAFERLRRERVTSGVGNCSAHYTRLKLVLLQAVRQAAPSGDLPTEDDWHRYYDE